MEIIYLVKGIIIGFSLAAPVGPIGILCIRRTLAHGDRRGFITGLGAASADAVYGVVAAFGITLVSDFVTGEQFWIRLVGGILLIFLGFRTFRSHPADTTPQNGVNGHTRTFVSTFFLTLTNPLTLFAFAAVFAGIGVEKIVDNHFSGTLLAGGVFLGSFLWFVLLTSLVHIFKEMITTKGLVIINKVSGSLIMTFGIIALLTLPR